MVQVKQLTYYAGLEWGLAAGMCTYPQAHSHTSTGHCVMLVLSINPHTSTCTPHTHTPRHLESTTPYLYTPTHLHYSTTTLTHYTPTHLHYSTTTLTHYTPTLTTRTHNCNPHLLVISERCLQVELPLQHSESGGLGGNELGLQLVVPHGQGGVPGEGLMEARLGRREGGMRCWYRCTGRTSSWLALI